MPSAEAVKVIHRALLGDAFSQATDLGAFVLDEDGCYVAVNDYACTLSGYARSEIIGERIGTFNAHLAAEYGAALASPHRTGRTHIDRKDGRRVPVGYRVSATRLGAMPYLLVVCWEDEPDAP
jgi:PAS domain S-box-containing protein